VDATVNIHNPLAALLSSVAQEICSGGACQ